MQIPLSIIYTYAQYFTLFSEHCHLRTHRTCETNDISNVSMRKTTVTVYHWINIFYSVYLCIRVTLYSVQQKPVQAALL